jgi:4-amino-4-deoxy-L-arabinose transferase-like glycosyltransferase
MKINIRKSQLALPVSLLLVTLIALWIRVAYFQNTVVDTPIRGDAVSYVKYAFNLVDHATFSMGSGTDTPQPDAYWAPGYPTFIAAAMLVEKNFGLNTYFTIIYTQVFIGALIAALTLLLGRLFLPSSWAIFAALLVAFSPHLISTGNNVLTETLFTLLLLMAIYIFLLGFRRQNKQLLAIAGLLFGLCYLVNPVVFFTPILFVGLAMAFYKYKQDKPFLVSSKLLAPCLLIFLIIVGAWTTRAAINVPADAPGSSTRLLTNLVVGTHDDFHAIWRANPRDPNNPAALDEKIINGSYASFINLLFLLFLLGCI